MRIEGQEAAAWKTQCEGGTDGYALMSITGDYLSGAGLSVAEPDGPFCDREEHVVAKSI